MTKVKSNLLNSKETVNRLKPEDESQLIMKLNEPLRQSIIFLNLDLQKHNNLSVLKSSIFFLCRWSKHFQIAVAEALIHSIYMPG